MSDAWSTLPSAASDSAGWILIVVPAGTVPSIVSEGQPTKFWPKSNTQTPVRGCVTRTGVTTSTIFSGCATRQTSSVVKFGGGAIPAAIHPTGEPSRRVAVSLVSAPGLVQPACSRRASWSVPENQLSVTVGPSAALHDRSLTIVSTEPSAFVI